MNIFVAYVVLVRLCHWAQVHEKNNHKCGEVLSEDKVLAAIQHQNVIL